MNTTTTTAEWIGAGILGLCALALVAAAAAFGESHANASADMALAAYRDQRHGPDSTLPAPLAIPPCPAYAPDITVPVDTVRLTTVTAHGARHRKGSRWI